MNKLLLVVVACLLLPFAQASIDVVLYTVADDFTVAAEGGTIGFCSCTSHVDDLLVKNIGSYPSIYSVSVDKDYVSVSESSFELLPGKEKHIYLTYGSICGQERTFSVDVLISSSTGKIKELQRDVVITTCQNIQFSANTAVESALPCSPITYELNLKNSGPFTETYTISSNQHDAFSDITLQPDEQTAFNRTYTLGCHISGEQPFTFSVKAHSSKLSATTEDTVTIQPSYDYELLADGTWQNCLSVDNALPITITNIQHFANDYTLAVVQNKRTRDGYYVDNARVHLEAGETRTVLLKVQPLDDRDIGQHEMTLTVKSDIGNIVKSIPITTTTRVCYALTLTLPDDQAVCPGDHTYPAIVRNNGLFTETVQLSATGAVIQEQIILDPGQESAVSLDVTANDVDGNATITAQAERTPAVASDSMVLMQRSERTCRQPLLDYAVVRLLPDMRSFALNIRGSFKESVYILGLSGPEWMQLNQSFIRVEQDALVPLLIVMNDSQLGTFQGTVQLTDADTALVYTLPFEVSIQEKPFISKLYTFLLLHPCLFVPLVLLVLLIVALVVLLSMPKIRVTKKFKKQHKTHFRVFAFTAVVFILLAAILLLFITVPVDYPALSADKISWYENQQYTMDLSGYFYSPEHSLLTFSASPVENIAVSIDENEATFVPDKNWYGERMITFTASDVASASASSNAFTLEVVHVPKPTTVDYVVAYCEWFVAVLFMAFILVLFLIWLLRK